MSAQETRDEQDVVERLGESLVQHGRLNDRVYLMRLDPADAAGAADLVEDLARARGYAKVFAKVPAAAGEVFLGRGYEVEAQVPGFFRGEEDGLFLAKYLDPSRRARPALATVGKVLLACGARRAEAAPPPPLDASLTLRPLDAGHAAAIARVYGRVFASYPFPIHDPGYIEHAMQHDVSFFGVFSGDELVAVSSAEAAPADRNAEMTDFATLPEHRGRQLATHLLLRMEEAMRADGLATLYTIARAVSYGMNITFARLGYDYAGTLVNNTNIAGAVESMNVWYKPLR